MKHLERNHDFKISQLYLSLIPSQITFHNTQAQSYTLQLCKGPQIYKQFAEHIWVHAGQNSYRFLDGQSATVRLQNEKNMSCDWNFYKITDDDLRDFIGSVTVDLTTPFNTYLQNLKKYSKEYNKLLASHQLGQEIAKEWKKIKQQISHQFDLQGRNLELKVDLKCKLRVKCQIDRLAEEQTARIREKKLAKAQSKISVSFSSKKSGEEEGQAAHSHQILEAHGYASEITQQISYIKVIKPQRVAKKETLSDIVQVSLSNEHSSNLNFGDRASKKPFQGTSQAVSEIPEEYEPSSPFRISTRTQNYDNLGLKEDIDNLLKNRSNTSDQNVNRENQSKNDLFPKPNPAHNASKDHTENEGEQEHLGKSELQQGIQTAPQSLLKPQEHQTGHLPLGSRIQEPISVQEKGKTFSYVKVICVLLLLIVLTIGSLYQMTGFDGYQQVGAQEQKIQRKKTTKISKSTKATPNKQKSSIKEEKLEKSKKDKQAKMTKKEEEKTLKSKVTTQKVAQQKQKAKK